MRWLFSTCLLLLFGCGGQIGSTSGEDAGANDTCMVGPIGGTPGVPHVLAYSNHVFFTVSPVEQPDGGQPAFGALEFLRDDGKSGGTLVDNGVDDSTVVPLGDSVAFMRDGVSASRDFVASSIEIVGSDGTNAQTIDRASNSVEEFSSLTSDGVGGIAWLRWPSSPATGNVSPTIGRWNPKSEQMTVTTLDAPVYGIESLVSYGATDFALFSMSDVSVVESLPENGATVGIYVPGFANPDKLFAADDERLIYEESIDGYTQLWSAPMSGESVIVAPNSSPGVAPVLRNHVLYWVDPTNAPATEFWSYRFGGGGTHRIGMTDDVVQAIAVDDCGLDVATSSQDGASVITRYALGSN